MRASIKLTTVADLFSTEESRADEKREKVLDIPLSEISDFPGHPFKVKADEAMLEMADSVKQYGVLVPGLVRPKADGGYEMVAGHRRKKASELAGSETMPCIVRELDDDQATIIMVDSNLQREYILPSEKAFAYKMKLEAMKRQGQRTDLTSAQLGRKLEGKESREILAEQVGESKNQISRYIRLTELTPSILEMVDDKRIAFNPAVELSYLSEEEQQALYETMQSEDCTPSLAQAQRMKKLSQDGRLNVDVIFSILTEEKPNQKEKMTIRRERVDRFFPREFTEKQKEDLIVQLLESWYKKRQREQER
ncbi:MAG: ParB/RepB/Spo0J family partition protein [Paenibacillus macerans]|jgi:ParB family chromosome partitioning protein|uniref:ParB/RepB/Spo0J family partition protein n=3 Tax=Paenibacillaceae TaxID=186822 RepID=A0A5D0CME2_9BACL|nr:MULTISPECIES: ParB/RepB/Spo0J family partition protein [Paenibacillus]MBS5910726.1 ParB/RepB/Spo0J family partition protein [Paenibacillus macerans]MDO3679749.1 ParB/RepB/Spo0J family partition protein [Paenibacillus ehimensis]MDU5945674.1 ParB/RepB/Spo0J family partition protein [Paenibacillus macerans]MDU7472304.1 ParB/RepB/Spo0J family partition protein [Paenibacillus macerans]TYA11066.1 ParB/RepB/Spo0J family partition protein [Paenibacillus faecis]